MHTSPLLQPGQGSAGGMNVYIHELACTMAGRGIDVVVFTRTVDEPDEVVVGENYRVVHVPAGPATTLAIDDLARHVGAFTDGVIKWIDASDALFDVIHSHYWLSGWAGVLVKEALAVPLANSFHTLGRVKDLARRADEPESGPMRTLTEAEVIARADCVVAATQHEFDDLLEHYGASPERLRTSPPGIDHNLFSPGDKTQARTRIGLTDRPTALFAGRIQPHKGVDVAVRAVATLSNLQLVVVGGPSGTNGEAEMAALHALVGELGIAYRVTFVLPQPHDVLADFYRAADVLVMPSRSESFGLVAAEAQACGLPVVATRVGGLAHVVSHDVSGVLVDGDDPAAFATAIERIVTDPDMSARLSRGGIDKARMFSWPAAADRLIELYEGMVKT